MPTTARQAKTTGEKMRLKNIDEYDNDADGAGTIAILTRGLEILSRITGNSPGSLGLHPAVYFYNERGKHSRFLFLAMTLLVADKLRNNDGGFFKKFSLARRAMEKFIIENKSLIGILLQNMSKGQRIQKTRDLFDFLVAEFSAGREVTAESAIRNLGISGRVFDVDANAQVAFPDDIKSMVFVQRALEAALRCPICDGVLDPKKSVSYDHVIPVREGGLGTPANAQLVHPYCNSAMKETMKHER